MLVGSWRNWCRAWKGKGSKPSSGASLGAIKPPKPYKGWPNVPSGVSVHIFIAPIYADLLRVAYLHEELLVLLSPVLHVQYLFWDCEDLSSQKAMFTLQEHMELKWVNLPDVTFTNNLGIQYLHIYLSNVNFSINGCAWWSWCALLYN